MKTLTFVIPFYNERARIQKTLDSLLALKLPKELSLDEVIFVNDGSTDTTESYIETAVRKYKFPSTITLIRYAENKGKGHAVKQGMLASNADYTLLFDADMSTPLSELTKFIPEMKRNTDVIVGTRKNGRSTVVKHQPKYREVLGHGFTILTQNILNVQITDFTCGFKAFSKKAKNSIFAKSLINRWGYDAEIIYLASKDKFSITEVPVLWSNDPRTRVNLLKDIVGSLKELITIRVNDALGAYTPRISASFAK